MPVSPSKVRVLAVTLAVLMGAGRADAGHEITFYPSFYPQEITVQFLDPAVAAKLLEKKSLHAYVGGDPFARGAVPGHVVYARSLGPYLALTFERSAKAFADSGARCAAAARVLAVLAPVKSDYVVHPYPVTPYHDDYLHHFDAAQAARKRPSLEPGGRVPRIRARGRAATLLAQAGLKPAEGEADATLEDVDVRAALDAAVLTGIAPPWVKEGWYHAYRLHADAVRDATARRAIEEAVSRRLSETFESAAARINHERRLVALLTHGCERVTVGYAIRREPLNDDYSDGVENVAHDAQAGLVSATFIRTVKLKDFPWNGWLRIGVAPRAAAAWNPVAGFTDDAGRLIWSAVGDTAFISAPANASVVPNRVRPVATEVVARAGPSEAVSRSPSPPAEVAIPVEALVPDSAAGLRAAGRGLTAAHTLQYRVLASKFHDGTKMTAADLVYPVALAARWSPKDPAIERATATARAALVAMRVVRIDTEVKEYGELQLVHEVPHVEVYLNRPADPRYVAALAPPWSAVPWQLTVLMEEAVTRGLAAFSEAEARRRGLAWLDVVRDRKLVDALAPLAEGFERRAHVPEALRGLVTVADARQRWAALRRFHRQHGHWLVTNGPYRLGKWSATSVVLPVFRDLSFPVGVGTYDRFARPVRAYVTKVERRGDRLELQAEVEKVTRFERSYKIGREPYRPEPPSEKMREPAPSARYVVVDAAGEVVTAGTAGELDGDKVVVDFRRALPAGSYRVLVALALNDNFVEPEVRVVPYRVPD